MFEKICSKNVLTAIVALWIMTVFASLAEAKSPIIIRYDAQLMEQGIKINLAWQSDEPVVKIIASAGREQIVFERNIDNERTESGYTGEIDIVVPAYVYGAAGGKSMYVSRQSSSPVQQSSMEMYANSTSSQNEAVQYSVQLVDEVNQRSVLLKDRVQRIEPTYRKTGQSTQPKQTTGLAAIDINNPANTVLNTTIGLVGKIGQTPDVKNVKIKNWSENRISISFDATGSKGIDKVVYEVRNSRGDIASQNSILCNSEKQCTRQSDPFALNPGRYSVSITAIDIETNVSKRIEQEFQVTDNAASVQTSVSQFPVQQAPQQSSTAPLPADNGSGIIYEKE